MDNRIDFSHLHALEAKLVRQTQQRDQAFDAEKRSLSVWVTQTENEIADERAFLGLDVDISDEELYNELSGSEWTSENPDYIAY